MKLVFLYGLPATGKLTVAKELASLTGFRLFHNHLTVDLLLSVFEFGSPAFVKLREQIWLSVFDEARTSGIEGLIFTFVPERTVRPEFIQEVFTRKNAFFVELVCAADERKVRLQAPSRAGSGKLTSPEMYEQLRSDGVFDVDYMSKPELRIDTGKYSAHEAAQQIAARLTGTRDV